MGTRGEGEPEGRADRGPADVVIVVSNPDHGLLLEQAVRRVAPRLGVDRIRAGEATRPVRCRLLAVADEVAPDDVGRLVRDGDAPTAGRLVLLTTGAPRWPDDARRRLGVDAVLDRCDPDETARRLAALARETPVPPPPSSPARSDDLLERLRVLVAHQRALVRALRRVTGPRAAVWLDALDGSLARGAALIDRPADGSSVRAAGEPASAEPRARPRALVIDDDRRVAEMIGEMLDLKGIEVVHAPTGRRALDLLAAGCEYEIALLDLDMPGLDGAQTWHELRRLAPGLPVVLVTASPDDPRVATLRREGLRDVLAKPFGVRDLLAAVDRLRARRAPPPR
ncbi:MAG: response regulator [Acidobacteria bacterium]|nr:MAG: response regulator [Acidobacteriota bacterium]